MTARWTIVHTVAARIGRSRSTFSRLVTAGKIQPHSRYGENGPMLFRAADVDRLAAERTAELSEAPASVT